MHIFVRLGAVSSLREFYDWDLLTGWDEKLSFLFWELYIRGVCGKVDLNLAPGATLLVQVSHGGNGRVESPFLRSTELGSRCRSEGSQNENIEIFGKSFRSRIGAWGAGIPLARSSKNLASYRPRAGVIAPTGARQ